MCLLVRKETEAKTAQTLACTTDGTEGGLKIGEEEPIV